MEEKPRSDLALLLLDLAKEERDHAYRRVIYYEDEAETARRRYEELDADLKEFRKLLEEEGVLDAGT